MIRDFALVLCIIPLVFGIIWLVAVYVPGECPGRYCETCIKSRDACRYLPGVEG